MNNSVEQPAPAARNVRLLWAILAAVFGLIFLVQLFLWSKGKADIRSALLPAAVALVNIGEASEQGALRRMLLTAGFVLGALGALLMTLHWANG